MVTLFEHFMIILWISAFSNAGVIVMHYPETFIYKAGTVPSWHIAGFPNNVSQFAVFSRGPGARPDVFSSLWWPLYRGILCVTCGQGRFSNPLWSSKEAHLTRKSRAVVNDWNKCLFIEIYSMRIYSYKRGGFRSVLRSVCHGHWSFGERQKKHVDGKEIPLFWYGPIASISGSL